MKEKSHAPYACLPLARRRRRRRTGRHGGGRDARAGRAPARSQVRRRDGVRYGPHAGHAVRRHRCDVVLRRDVAVDGERTGVQRKPVHAPSPRCCVGMAYDAARGEVVLFGGYEPRAATSATPGPGTARTGRSSIPAHSPSPRDSPGMVFDGARGEVVLFGGAKRRFPRRHLDLGRHGLDAAHPGALAPARDGPGMACDDARGRSCCSGGSARLGPRGHLDLGRSGLDPGVQPRRIAQTPRIGAAGHDGAATGVGLSEG